MIQGLTLDRAVGGGGALRDPTRGLDHTILKSNEGRGEGGLGFPGVLESL